MIIKSIRAFFLIVAVVAIVFHMIIPHDHHLAGPSDGLKERCPFSDEKSDHHPIFPLHCHAFNDMAVDKFSQIVVRQGIQPGFVSVILHPGFILPESHISKAIIENSGNHFPDIFVINFSPFRAPPSIV